MHRFIALICAALLLTVGIGFAVSAQDEPAEGEQTVLCATPLAEMDGTPATVVIAPSPAASPGGSAPGTPIGLVPCGTPNPEGSSGDNVEAQTTEFTVEMVDIAFSPDTITIPADTDVTINLPNNGVALHDFNIDELDIHTEDVPGGGSTSVTINAPAGTYEFYCSIPGHLEAGMIGTLIVE